MASRLWHRLLALASIYLCCTQINAPPSLEFIDLPGIQAIPGNESGAIVEEYLNRGAANTLVVCVIEANTAALNASMALGMLNRRNQLSNTILALTKADKVWKSRDQDDLNNMIFSRLLGKWSGHEYLDQLLGCVAVANRVQRQHSDTTNLVDHDVEERDLFASMLTYAEQSMQPAFTPAEMQRLKDNMSSKQLMVKLEAEYNKRIVDVWIPSVRKQAAELQVVVGSNLMELGTAPELVNLNDMLQRVQAQVNHLFLSTNMTMSCKANMYACGSEVLLSLQQL